MDGTTLGRGAAEGRCRGDLAEAPGEVFDALASDGVGLLLDRDVEHLVACIAVKTADGGRRAEADLDVFMIEKDGGEVADRTFSEAVGEQGEQSVQEALIGLRILEQAEEVGVG